MGTGIDWQHTEGNQAKSRHTPLEWGVDLVWSPMSPPFPSMIQGRPFAGGGGGFLRHSYLQFSVPQLDVLDSGMCIKV